MIIKFLRNSRIYFLIKTAKIEFELLNDKQKTMTLFMCAELLLSALKENQIFGTILLTPLEYTEDDCYAAYHNLETLKLHAEKSMKHLTKVFKEWDMAGIANEQFDMQARYMAIHFWLCHVAINVNHKRAVEAKKTCRIILNTTLQTLDDIAKSHDEKSLMALSCGSSPADFSSAEIKEAVHDLIQHLG